MTRAGQVLHAHEWRCVRLGNIAEILQYQQVKIVFRPLYVQQCENVSQVLDTYLHLGLKVFRMSKIVAMTTLVVQHLENTPAFPTTST